MSRERWALSVAGDLPAPIPALCDAFLSGLQTILGDNLAGVYLYGATTFPDSRDMIQDIDFHVFVERPLIDRDRGAIDRLHKHDLAQGFPSLGGELDGYYITIADARETTPRPTQMYPLWRTPVDAAWALHCAHVRAGRCIVLFGPDPSEIYPQPSWDDLHAALQGEKRYIEAHLAAAPAYCILNACRIVYSLHRRDVVISKRAAATWALDHLPTRHHDLIRTALRAYAGKASAEEEQALRSDVRTFVADTQSEW